MNTATRPSRRALARARRQLTREHPQIRGVRVKITPNPNKTFTLTFKSNHRLPDGATLRQTLRATIDEEGKVLRVTVSR